MQRWRQLRHCILPVWTKKKGKGGRCRNACCRPAHVRTRRRSFTGFPVGNCSLLCHARPSLSDPSPSPMCALAPLLVSFLCRLGWGSANHAAPAAQHLGAPRPSHNTPLSSRFVAPLSVSVCVCVSVCCLRGTAVLPPFLNNGKQKREEGRSASWLPTSSACAAFSARLNTR